MASSTFQKTDLDKRFEYVLNECLTKVADKMRAYKKQRKILAELVKPVNLQNSSYIEENYQISVALIPDIRMKIDDVIQTFENTDIEIRSLLSNQPVKVHDNILEEWNILKKKRISSYVNFFIIEEEILQIYSSLLKLYHNARETLTVDLEKNKIIFSNFINEQEEQNLLNKLSVLSIK
ncbi:MAG: hypothetical protein KAJ86_08270 [Alphaproteobacteria bacterium]|nr:hypothetical protein [Alphaproteobacteria bacterium]